MGLSYASRKRSRSASGSKKNGPASVEVHKSIERWSSIGEFLSLRLEQNKAYTATFYRGKQSVPVVCNATSVGAIITFDRVARPWFDAPWDEITAFALDDEEVQNVLVQTLSKSNGKDPFIQGDSEEDSEIEEKDGEKDAISRAVSSELKDAMHEMVSEMALLRQALMTQLSSAAGTVGAPTPVSTSATSVPATGVASAGNATVAQSSGAPTPDATPATATQETAGSAVPCFELFNIATWPAHLGHLSKYDRKDFLEEHLLADEQRYVKLQKTPFTILLSLVDAACEFPKTGHNGPSSVASSTRSPRYIFSRTPAYARALCGYMISLRL
eukprot:gene12644-biopygen9074